MKTLLAVFLLTSVLVYSQIDKNGNRIFKSVPYASDTLDYYTLNTYYYSLTYNIDNPNSSVFVSEKPSNDEIIKFVRTRPTYFFLIQYNQSVSPMIMLVSRIEGMKSVYSFYILNPNTQEQTEIPTELSGDVTEARAAEMIRKYPKQAMEIKHGFKKMLLFGDVAYSIQPFESVKAELTRLINKHKLYKPDVNLNKVRKKN